MKSLILILLTIPFLASCGANSGFMTEPEKERYFGEVNGLGAEADRVSQARPRVDQTKNVDGVDLSDIKLKFDKSTRKLSANLKYFKRKSGKSLSFRLYIDGYFSDFTKPAVLKDPRSKSGDVVRGYAFCKEPIGQVDQCDFIVVDLYFLDENNKLDKIQVEKRFTLDLREEEPVSNDSTSEKLTPAKPPASAGQANANAQTAENKTEKKSNEQQVDDNHGHDENLPSVPGDIQTKKPKDKSFYEDFISPDVNQSVPRTNYEKANPRIEYEDVTREGADDVTYTEKPAQVEPVPQPAPAPVNNTVQLPEASEANKQVTTPSVTPTPTSTPTPTPTPVAVASQEPSERAFEGEEVIDAISSEEIVGERITASERLEEVEQEEQRSLTTYELIGIGGEEDRNQAIGHYADSDLRYGRAKLVGAEVRLGVDGDHVGIKRDDSNDRYNGYATSLMVKTLIYAGEWTNESLSTHMVVDDISKRGGGKLGGHSSHRNGLDADIKYIGNHRTYRGSFDVEKNWQLLYRLYELGNVKAFFVSQGRKNQLCQYARQNGFIRGYEDFTKRLYVEPNHHNHFHLRLVCTDLNPRCRDDADYSWQPCR